MGGRFFEIVEMCVVLAFALLAWRFTHTHTQTNAAIDIWQIPPVICQISTKCKKNKNIKKTRENPTKTRNTRKKKQKQQRNIYLFDPKAD